MRTLEALTGDDDLEDTFAQATDCLAELLPAVLPAVMMEPREAEIDSLLRRSIAAPIPSLPPDFDQRLMREVRRSSQPLDRYRRILLTGYGLMSVVASAVVMRGQGLDWGAISVMILGPLALVAAARWARRATYTTIGHGAQ